MFVRISPCYESNLINHRTLGHVLQKLIETHVHTRQRLLYKEKNITDFKKGRAQ